MRPDEEVEFIADDDSKGRVNQDYSTSVDTMASSVAGGEGSAKNEESTERKPRKEKPKRKILLAPSFFVEKKE